MPCRLQTYFETKLALMAPSETVVLSRESLAWILENHAACACTEPANSGMAVPAPLSRYSARELGRAVGRKPSTMRNHLTNGLCGDPARAKDSHGEFSVPVASVEMVRRMLADGHALGTFCILPFAAGIRKDGSEPDEIAAWDPGATPLHAPESTPPSPGTGDTPGPETSAPNPPRPPAQLRGRDHVAAPASDAPVVAAARVVGRGDSDTATAPSTDLGSWRSTPHWRKRVSR